MEDQLALKVEELRERDEDLMKAIARNSELEASLKVKEDELELSRGVMAENADLQAKVATLTAELGTKAAEIDGLKGELSVSTGKLATVVSETAALENTLCVCRSELTKEKKASELKVAGLEGCFKELEAELSALNGQVALLRTEDASRRSQPSTSRASADPVVPRRLYELWVHAEARLDVYKALHAEARLDVYKALHADRRASEVELQGVRAEAREAREACGYNPLTPDGDDINSDDANCLTYDSWYEDVYPTGDDV
ncbi:uncharacterized protein [Nicotiana sylvestris]|uniref:uncharacterized protein n=1 Tax=Nicotiana sylvestris TaxID=4096 RepID=UPI00388CBA33